MPTEASSTMRVDSPYVFSSCVKWLRRSPILKTKCRAIDPFPASIGLCVEGVIFVLIETNEIVNSGRAVQIECGDPIILFLVGERDEVHA